MFAESFAEVRQVFTSGYSLADCVMGLPPMVDELTESEWRSLILSRATAKVFRSLAKRGVVRDRAWWKEALS